MLLSSPIAFARAQAQTDSNGLTDPNAIIFANAGLNDFHRQLVQSGVDASQIQESYTDGVVPATDGNGSTFLYPTDALWLKAIEVNYADTQANNYKKAEQVDVSNIPAGASFSWLRKNANKQFPLFDDHGDWYEIFPAFTSADNTSQAIRIFYFLKPTQYTTTGDTVAYPENMDETILGNYMVGKYLYSLKGAENKVSGDNFMANYQKQVKDYLATLGRGSQQPTQAVPLQINGWQF